MPGHPKLRFHYCEGNVDFERFWTFRCNLLIPRPKELKKKLSENKRKGHQLLWETNTLLLLNILIHEISHTLNTDMIHKCKMNVWVHLCDHKNWISVPKPLYFLTGSSLDSRRNGKSCWCHCSLTVDHARFNTTIVCYLFRWGMGTASQVQSQSSLPGCNPSLAILFCAS